MSMLSYPHAVVTSAGDATVIDLGSYRASKIAAQDVEEAGAALHAQLLAEAHAEVFLMADQWLAEATTRSSLTADGVL